MNKKALVIDDTYDDLETAKDVLEKNGFKVITCTNAQEGLEVLESFRPDLILCNIMMPMIDGYEYVRKMPPDIRKNTKVVFISIVPDKEANLKDVDGFVQKPFTPESLMEEVRRVLGKNESGSAE
ncbi:response regulator [Candidatus Woesearchaeota archaeon]|nr:response regulator [Candidatus Woesearchaeota archaeon]